MILENYLKELSKKEHIDIEKYKQMAPKPNMATKIPAQFLKELKLRKLPDNDLDKQTLAKKHHSEVMKMHKDPQDYITIAENKLFCIMGDGAGNTLWYSLKDGSIWFHDHELKNKFIKQASNWKEWLRLERQRKLRRK